MTRQPPENQNLYAELSERVGAFELTRSFSSLTGSFTTKVVKDAAYWYFKTSEGPSGQREYYVGPDDESARKTIARYREGRTEAEAALEQIWRLCAMLRLGGSLVTDTANAKVLSALANAGVFKLGAVLIGTQAFIVIGNLLGVRWQSTLQTQDIDIAAHPTLRLVVHAMDADVPKTLDSLQMGFLPVPGLSRGEPYTSFKVRGQPLRVELLTPASGRRDEKPVPIPRLNTAAQPLEMLGYLMESPVRAPTINGGATLVNVPDAARYALHKLIISGRRPLHAQTKAAKDRQQAAEIIEVLYEDRRGDLLLAIDALNRRPKSWGERAKVGLDKLPAELAEQCDFIRKRLVAYTHKS